MSVASNAFSFLHSNTNGNWRGEMASIRITEKNTVLSYQKNNIRMDIQKNIITCDIKNLRRIRYRHLKWESENSLYLDWKSKIPWSICDETMRSIQDSLRSAFKFHYIWLTLRHKIHKIARQMGNLKRLKWLFDAKWTKMIR